MNAADHNNVVIFDDRGIPSIMCRFVRPKDTEEIPAVFKIGDKVADAIYISKYPNTVIDGRAYSMPMADPTVNITFDEAVQACRCKGLGWHLMTAVEYEYLLNQSREKGTMPHGNTDWGKDYYHKDEQGKVSNFYCEHPNHEYTRKYYAEHRIYRLQGFIGFGARYSEEVPVKTSPAWCPKKAEGSNE